MTLLCDRGERYRETLFDPAWLGARGIDRLPADAALRATLQEGRWRLDDVGARSSTATS